MSILLPLKYIKILIEQTQQVSTEKCRTSKNPNLLDDSNRRITSIRSFGCPIIHIYTIHNATLFTDTSTMLDITKPFL